jgi:heterogeneous nuclear rnp K-like protein 2
MAADQIAEFDCCILQAFSLIAATILENPAVPGLSFNGSLGSVEGQATIHLLISHALMGTVIGRQGLKIKHIQDLAGVKMVASKEMLPSSTERSVEVQGTAQGIETAVTEIGRCLLQDWERGQGTILYQPSPSSAGGRSLVAGARGGLLVGKQRVSTTIGVPRTLLNGTNVHQGGQTMSYKTLLANGRVASSAAAVTSGGELVAPMHDGATIPAQVIEGDIAVQNIGIPSDMVGCIIGKGGSKISEIRRISGSQISIAKMPHDESGERMFTIQGPVESNEKALFYLYNSLEAEKQKRAEAAAADAASNVSVVGGSIGGQQVVGA